MNITAPISHSSARTLNLDCLRLLLISISVVSQTSVSGALFGAGIFLLIPLFAHFAFTTLVTFLRVKVRLPYSLALAAGTVIHFFYNWYVMRGGLQ